MIMQMAAARTGSASESQLLPETSGKHWFRREPNLPAPTAGSASQECEVALEEDSQHAAPSSGI
eukprot:365906-Chlamydomonas_euryale.AAC.6